jgi:hypothetical protein
VRNLSEAVIIVGSLDNGIQTLALANPYDPPSNRRSRPMLSRLLRVALQV